MHLNSMNALILPDLYTKTTTQITRNRHYLLCPNGHNTFQLGTTMHIPKLEQERDSLYLQINHIYVHVLST